MALFGVLYTSGSGLYANRKWMDAISDNISNINNAVAPSQGAFRERFIEVQANDYGDVGGGVRVAAAHFGEDTGRLVYEPNNPIAEDGMVRYPDISLADQMTAMIMAQRSYQANLSIIDRARNAYEAALTLGK